ncbi:MAG: GTPase Era [Flavobacteriaceae bacterium]|jgi:GTP-binding protein Era
MSNAHRSGFINIIGSPNVGKSTLMNALVGERLSIITSKAQTTRHRILGFVNDEDYQMVFSDTPGIIDPAYKLQESMMDFVRSAFEDADILVYMVELGEKQLKDEQFFKKLQQASAPLLLLINKIDIGNQEALNEAIDHWTAQLPRAEIFPISALEGFGVDQVMARIKALLPLGPAYYPKDQLTDKTERFVVSEVIREKILLHYDKEIPYAVEIQVESFKESETIIHIGAVILVERDTQKGILIGHQGKGLKRVGTEARKDLEQFFAKKIHLEMHVKVSKNWRSDENQLRRFGYQG